MSELRLRVLSALFLLPLFVGISYVGGWPFLLLCLAAVWLTAGEISRLSPGGQVRKDYFVHAGALAAVLGAGLGVWRLLTLIPLLVILSVVRQWFAPSDPWNRVVMSLSWRLSAIAYASLLSFWLLLRNGPGGFEFFMFAVACTWLNDTVAFFAGSAWGVRKVVVRLSPGKTWVGALAGASSGALAGVAFALYIGGHPAVYGPVGAALAVAAQIGDLFVSMLKRGAGTKDSGRLIPGHGGILDRIDGLMFSIPLLVAIMQWSILP